LHIDLPIENAPQQIAFLAGALDLVGGGRTDQTDEFDPLGVMRPCTSRTSD